MKEQIEEAVKKCSDNAKDAKTAIEAQQYAQAVVNLTNALVQIETHGL